MGSSAVISKSWSDPTILKSIRNPAEHLVYRTASETSEVTFLGAERQPDFAHVLVEYVPGRKVIELKSLKFYFGDFRNRLLSYERFVSVVYEDLMRVYKPRHLRVTVKCNPRGGLSSTLYIDSDEQEPFSPDKEPDNADSGT